MRSYGTTTFEPTVSVSGVDESAKKRLEVANETTPRERIFLKRTIETYGTLLLIGISPAATVSTEILDLPESHRPTSSYKRN